MLKRSKKKDRLITRELFLTDQEVVTYLREDLKFPGVQQAAVLRKTDIHKEKKTVETWCFVTSAPSEKLSPKKFLDTIRNHWQVEDPLHWVKDVVFKEDDHYTRSPLQETALAVFRNVAVSVLNLNTPPEQRKITRPVEMLGYCCNPLKLLEILNTV
jgi:predicted transposase YbfD/YdcC